MAKVEEVKMHIRVFINQQKNKVLFAVAGSDFTDVLFSFLLLPLGTILKLLNEDEAPAVGSLNTLYNGVANLDSFHFHTEVAKQKLLAPKISSCYKNEWHKLRHNFIDSPPTSSNSVEKYDGVFTESEASFIISDDLLVMPNMPHSFIETLKNLGIDVADMDGAETRNVAFGMKEIDAILRLSLVSRNPLTDLLLRGKEMGSTSVISEHGNASSRSCINQKVVSMNPKKMILKAMIQKSSNKFLYAQADYDFINFLFGMLTVPLGKVEWFFGSNTGLKNMDNLRRSIADRSKNMHLNLKPAGKNMLLINPVPPSDSNYHSTTNEFSQLNFAPYENQCYVKGVRMYMVSDDLTVAPLAMSSCLSVLDKQKISVLDVEEVELRVGLEEGLGILKAALTSTTALTDCLIKRITKVSVTSDSALIKRITKESKASSALKRPMKASVTSYSDQSDDDTMSVTSDSESYSDTVYQTSKKQPKRKC